MPNDPERLSDAALDEQVDSDLLVEPKRNFSGPLLVGIIVLGGVLTVTLSAFLLYEIGRLLIWLIA